MSIQDIHQDSSNLATSSIKDPPTKKVWLNQRGYSTAPISYEVLARLVCELDGVRLIRLYDVNSEQYLWITSDKYIEYQALSEQDRKDILTDWRYDNGVYTEFDLTERLYKQNENVTIIQFIEKYPDAFPGFKVVELPITAHYHIQYGGGDSDYQTLYYSYSPIHII